jgi:GxxExxY protein
VEQDAKGSLGFDWIASSRAKKFEKLLPVHEKQVLTYLKLTGLRKGLLMNFNASLLKQGIRSIVR